MQPVVIFSHGKESGPKATKIVAMQEIVDEFGLKSYSLDYQGIETVEQRVEKLNQFMKTINRPFILVGSSMGAYVSLVASQNNPYIDGLFLLAPALGFEGYETADLAVSPHTKIVHGWRDEVVPVQNVIEFAQAHHIHLELVDDEHRLSESIERINVQLKNFLQELEL